MKKRSQRPADANETDHSKRLREVGTSLATMDPPTNGAAVPHLDDSPLPPAKRGVENLFLDELDPAPGNRDLGDLTSLVESVIRLGVLQPVVVRPHPKDETRYEIVAGHRRVEAARLAGAKSVPALVRELDDCQALEVRLVENLQRKDLHPLEEAEGYATLIERHGYSAEAIAARVHKSRSYVFGRLKFTELSKGLRAQFLSGELDASQALLVARIPDDKRQKLAWDMLAREHLPHREAVELVRAEFMLELKDAPFDTAAEGLVAGCPSCAACPKRTGNTPLLFADIASADVCTDSSCFKRKTDAAFAQRLEAHKAEGGKVLAQSKAKQLFQGRELRSWGEGSKWLEVDKPDRATGKKTVRNALGVALPTPVLVKDEEGGAHLLVERAAVEAAARKAGLVKKPASAKAEKQKEPAWMKRQRAQRKARELAWPMAVSACLDVAVSSSQRAALFPVVFEALVLRDVFAWADVAELLGEEGDDAKRLNKLRGSKLHELIVLRLEALGETARERVLLTLALEKGCTNQFSAEPFAEPLVSAARFLKVDLEKVQDRAVAALKVREAEKRGAKKKGKAKGS